LCCPGSALATAIASPTSTGILDDGRPTYCRCKARDMGEGAPCPCPGVVLPPTANTDYLPNFMVWACRWPSLEPNGSRRHPRLELGFRQREPALLRDVLARHRGSRLLLGYPACPNVAIQRHQLDWLGGGAASASRMDEKRPSWSRTRAPPPCGSPFPGRYFSA